MPTSPSHDVKRNLRLVTLAWGFGSVWMWTINGTALVQFNRSLGMPDWAFGVLGTLVYAGTLFQLPASYLLERFGQRKRFFLVAGAASRLLWSVAAAIPWMLPGRPDLWWPLMLAMVGLSWAFAQATAPAWMNWMGDLIPRRVRGRYFALRNNVGNAIGLVATLGVGYALDLTEQAGDAHLMLRVTSAILAIAGLLGTLDILCFIGVDDPEQPRGGKPVDIRQLFLDPLRDRNFRRYLAFNFVFLFGVGYIGQYVWLFLRDVALLGNWKSNMLLVAVPLVLRLMVYGTWGRLVDRLGKKPVILISGFITVFGTIGWLWVDAQRFWVGYIVVCLVTMAWPGFEIANFNLILDLAGTRREAGKTGRASAATGSAYVAVNSLVAAVGGVLSGLFGAFVAKSLEGWSMAIPALGIVLTYHGVLFLASTALRAAAMCIALTLREEHAMNTREAIRIMTTGFYSNMARMITFPARVAGNVAAGTYRLDGRK